MTKRKAQQRSQTTKEGTEIPIPKRGDFFDNLKKAATPEKSGSKASGPKKK